MTDRIRTMERMIVKIIIEDALDRGYTIFYYNDDESSPPIIASLKLNMSKELATDMILAEVGACDEEKIVIFDETNRRVGSVFLVFGNDGHDVICDHTSSKEMDDLLAGATELADRFAETTEDAA